jgi:DNA polymerase III delta prime subunit
MEQTFVEKYEPKTVDDVILDPSVRNLVNQYLSKQTINNLLFVGPPGIGKTTLAKIIPKQLDVMTLYVHCGMEGNIDTMNGKVAEFCDAGVFKIVVLDEADSLSFTEAQGRNSAQSALRNIIEKNLADTRFILTCNYPNKIIDAIKSRCIPINLACSIKDVNRRMVEIMSKEGVTYDRETLQLFVNEVVKRKFPDIRAIMELLEMWCMSGTLARVMSKEVNYDVILDFIISSDKPREIRKFLIENEILFDRNYIGLAQALFNMVKTEHEQEIIAEHIFRMHSVSDPEIQFSSMVIGIKKQ